MKFPYNMKTLIEILVVLRWKENHDNLQAAILNVELQFIYFNTYKL